MQEVSNEGGFRQATIHCYDYSSHENTIEFSLSRGSFATIVLREIMKPTDPIEAGFWDLFYNNNSLDVFKLLCFLEKLIEMEKAYMLISCEIGEEQSLYSQLKEISEVKNCLITYGSYDVVAEFVTETSQEMNEIITSKIRKLQNIRSTITLRVTN